MDMRLAQLIGRYLVMYRRDPEAAKAAQALRHAYQQSENFNFEISENGERDVLTKLAAYNFSTIFDVGAHVGKWTMAASEVFPHARIHCFEVAEPTLVELRKNLDKKANIVIAEFGLSNKEDIVHLKYYPETSWVTSMFDTPVAGRHEPLKGRVKVGDDYVEANKIEQIDFLKIDVEGAEALVLDGLRRSFSGGKIKIVQFEYGQPNIGSRVLLMDLYRFFYELGFVVGKIFPGYVEFRDYNVLHEDFMGPNFLAVRRDQVEQIRKLSA